MLRLVHPLICLFLAGMFLSACSVPQPVVPVGPEEFNPRLLVKIAIDGVFAVDPQAEKVAVDRAGLYLILTRDGSEKILTEKTPVALAWSFDGSQLAAAFVDGGQTRIVVYAAGGLEEASVMAPGRVTQLNWHSDGELFALSLKLDTFSFGTNQKASLLRWTPRGSLNILPLFDTTLKRRTVTELGDELYRLTRFDLSSMGDEIVYTRLADPPVIWKSLKLTHKHLSTGNERWVYDLPLQSGGNQWFFDSESLLLSDGNRSYVFDPWKNKELQLWPSPGQHLALSAMGNMIYIDGFLYRDDQEFAQLQSGRAVFSASGSHLLVADQGSLFIYDLPSFDSSGPIAQNKLERLLLLRELRSKNLLTIEEYFRAREDILQ